MGHYVEWWLMARLLAGVARGQHLGRKLADQSLHGPQRRRLHAQAGRLAVSRGKVSPTNKWPDEQVARYCGESVQPGSWARQVISSRLLAGRRLCLSHKVSE